MRICGYKQMGSPLLSIFGGISLKLMGTLATSLRGKLRLLKEELKKWNKEVFADIKVQKYNLLGTISSFDLKEESTG